MVRRAGVTVQVGDAEAGEGERGVGPHRRAAGGEKDEVEVKFSTY
jgi:hypothetical protein